MLFVNNDETQIKKVDPIFQQCMGANNNSRLTGSYV